MNAAVIEKTVEGRVMDELGLIRLCCRKIFLGHIELV
jgi:DNA-directed RNA polymerase subunit N (RpoN/RPB10)